MARIRLRIDRSWYLAETFIRLQLTDGAVEYVLAAVDTGAHTSLLPISLLAKVEHDMTEEEGVVLEQAGVAHQRFEAVEAVIKLSLEDEFGGATGEFEAPVWFAETDSPLVGFRGILERAVLHLDMPNLSGYLEFPDQHPDVQ
jgi:hypothetical protein